MENKIKFSDQPRKVKIVYAAVIAVLCITAVVIGIVSAASRKPDAPSDEPVVNLPSDSGNTETPDNEKPDNHQPEPEKPKKLSFVSPVVGKVTKGHSLEIPVFSDTLQEWRVHTGIDISADEGASVYSAEEGMVTKVYSDPFLGKTVEVSHEGAIYDMSRCRRFLVVFYVRDEFINGLYWIITLHGYLWNSSCLCRFHSLFI